MTVRTFSQMLPSEPDLADLERRYAELTADWASAADPAARRAVLDAWETLRRGFSTWHELVQVRFTQDTRDAAARQARERGDELEPRVTSLEVAFLQRILGEPHGAEVEQVLGAQAVALHRLKIAAYDPRIEADRIREAKLGAEYTDLIAQAKIPFQGETWNHAGIAKFGEDPDREVRRGAAEARWHWFEEHGAETDRLYDELVGLRHEMARKLGHADFVALGYQRQKRIDYDRSDVERFRKTVREDVVPLCERLMARRAADLGLDELMFWDEALADPAGNPTPRGDPEWTEREASALFHETHPELGAFYDMLGERGLRDLVTREGKAAGGYTTFFETETAPFVFANFNGTKGDVDVLTHELGHAFQAWCSRDRSPMEYRFPTLEACEIHSMSLELLTWPAMERLFGDQAERYRRVHLEGNLLFLPYGVAVDHFQHRVYEEPQAGPAGRHAIWREMEALYLPWRRNGGIPWLERGGRWQAQLHIYQAPFYYIDYTLALTCALQLWAWAERDRPAAFDAYIALCKRGGTAPFQDLVRGASLTSPFDDGCLSDVVQHAAGRLDL